jgi:hypothetical protein
VGTGDTQVRGPASREPLSPRAVALKCTSAQAHGAEAAAVRDRLTKVQALPTRRRQTGAMCDLDLNGPSRVRLHSKGDKWRSCPIWPETAELLTS